jgi:hypothetical protein
MGAGPSRADRWVASAGTGAGGGLMVGAESLIRDIHGYIDGDRIIVMERVRPWI